MKHIAYIFSLIVISSTCFANNATSMHSREYISRIMNSSAINAKPGSLELSYKTYADEFSEKSQLIDAIATKTIGTPEELSSYFMLFTINKILEDRPAHQNIMLYMYKIMHAPSLEAAFKAGATTLKMNREHPVVIINVTVPGSSIERQWYSELNKSMNNHDKFTNVVEKGRGYQITKRAIPTQNKDEYLYNICLYMIDRKHSVFVEYSFFDTKLNDDTINEMANSLKSLDKVSIMETNVNQWNLGSLIKDKCNK